MVLKNKLSAKSKFIKGLFDFILKYWIIFAGIVTGLFALYQYLSRPDNNKEEINNIRINYTQLLDLSSRIVVNVAQERNIDSLSREFEVVYGKFIPLKNDTAVFPYLRDFRLELKDFKDGTSTIEKLTYRQRCLLKSITEELKHLQ